MAFSFKSVSHQFGKLGPILMVALGVYFLYELSKYMGQKGRAGHEGQGGMPSHAKSSSSSSSATSFSQPVALSADNGLFEGNFKPEFSSAQGLQTSSPSQVPQLPSRPQIENPADLLPKDQNQQWAMLNPTGKGELENINLLKAGHFIGIDTVGQSLRNPSYDIRSQPPVPKFNTGPWMQSTITGDDYMKPPFEIGIGKQ